MCYVPDARPICVESLRARLDDDTTLIVVREDSAPTAYLVKKCGARMPLDFARLRVSYAGQMELSEFVVGSDNLARES